MREGRRDQDHPVNQVMRGRLSRLRHTYRYSAQPVVFRENVAEHSFWTAMIGVVVSLTAYPSDIALASEVALKGMMHDIEESFTGDLVRDMKYFNSETREAIQHVEDAFADRLFGTMRKPGLVLQAVWKTAKDSTPSGRIVALADLLCVIAYCDHERQMGNRELTNIRKECFYLIRDKFEGDEKLWPIIQEVV